MEHLVLRIASEQRRRGTGSAILALRRGPLSEEARAEGVETYVPQGGRLLRILHAVGYLMRFRPDVIHAHNATSLHYALLGKRFLRAPVILTCHGRVREDARRTNPRDWRRANAVVAVSHTTARQLDGLPIGDRLAVIHNGVEIERRTGREQTREALAIQERFVGIMVARIDGLKGHDTLLQAASALAGRYPGLALLVVGDGAKRAEIEREAEERGLSPEPVRFLGFRSDVPDLLAAADFFVLPSVTEGLPLSVLEAMAQGLPVIATPVGGVPELVVPEETGVLAPVGDAPALASAMERLIQNPALAREMGARGEQRVRDCFSFERMLDAYDALYASLPKARASST